MDVSMYMTLQTNEATCAKSVENETTLNDNVLNKLQLKSTVF